MSAGINAVQPRGMSADTTEGPARATSADTTAGPARSARASRGTAAILIAAARNPVIAVAERTANAEAATGTTGPSGAHLGTGRIGPGGLEATGTTSPDRDGRPAGTVSRAGVATARICPSAAGARSLTTARNTAKASLAALARTGEKTAGTGATRRRGVNRAARSGRTGPRAARGPGSGSRRAVRAFVPAGQSGLDEPRASLRTARARGQAASARARTAEGRTAAPGADPARPLFRTASQRISFPATPRRSSMGFPWTLPLP
jgi:hypothetical protein